MNRFIFARIILVCFLQLLIISSNAQTADWIWLPSDGQNTSTNEVRFFRKTFKAPAKLKKAELAIVGDDQAIVYLNGKRLVEAPAWVVIGFKAQRLDITQDLLEGENVLAARVDNSSVSAGLLAQLELINSEGGKETLVTDSSWLVSSTESARWNERNFQPIGWKNAVGIGKHGVQPWGNLLETHRATPASDLVLLPGYKAELLHSAQPDEGSWICMTFDSKGRVIISPQEFPSPSDGGLIRITLSGQGQIQKMERIRLPVGVAMGLLYAHDSLYLSGQGPNGTGLYRITDSNGDDQLDRVQFLKGFPGAEGEHGAHAIRLGPDNKLYLIHGNGMGLPGGISPSSPFQNYQEDDLTPPLRDPVATFFDKIKKPYGYVLRTDAEGKTWELVCAGLRNTYDFDFNQQGEMIAFDSDMEWDVGLPWYRPTRILHLVSGGEYGFREGSSKWPSYYADSLPAAVNVGLSSPTGVKFGTTSQFPGKYKKALFAMDWSYGRILAVHLEPAGASYTGTFETFASGKPLPVTDLEFGQDGAMYFIIGGRGTQAGLYRISYVGPDSRTAESSLADSTASARALRRKLESFHGKKDPAALDFSWAHLDNPDHWIRFAARVAIESQDVSLWKNRALSETRTNAALSALLALARNSTKETQADLLKTLARFPLDSLTDEQKLAKLRVISLSFTRQGRPEPELIQLAIQKLDRQYPARSEPLNRELSRLLAYLEVPNFVEKTLPLLQSAPTQEEQIHYAFILRNVKSGWTIPGRQQYLEWFIHALTDYRGGNSFAKFLEAIRQEAVTSFSADERSQLASLIQGRLKAENAQAVQRNFVKDWLMADLEPALDQVAKGRSFERGKKLFSEAQCLSCHRFGNEGGSVGPDITAAASRFNRRDLLETIVEPSKVVSDQYLSTMITKRDTTELNGLVVEEDAHKLVLLNPATQQKSEILKADIEERSSSKLSPMPQGLINVLSKEEILDLLAYIESGGNSNHPGFRK